MTEEPDTVWLERDFRRIREFWWFGHLQISRFENFGNIKNGEVAIL